MSHKNWSNKQRASCTEGQCTLDERNNFTEKALSKLFKQILLIKHNEACPFILFY